MTELLKILLPMLIGCYIVCASVIRADVSAFSNTVDAMRSAGATVEEAVVVNRQVGRWKAMNDSWMGFLIPDSVMDVHPIKP